MCCDSWCARILPSHACAHVCYKGETTKRNQREEARKRQNSLRNKERNTTKETTLRQKRGQAANQEPDKDCKQYGLQTTWAQPCCLLEQFNQSLTFEMDLSPLTSWAEDNVWPIQFMEQLIVLAK